MRPSVLILLVIATCLVIEPTKADPSGSTGRVSSGLAMYGTPKYQDGFKSFDYVNPEAPKGGVLKLAANGTFDSLNPFIIRGQPALGLNTGYLSLVYEPLMARSQDEPFTLYGLIAQNVVVAKDRSSILFNLNPNARWSDGKPLTADDVLFSFALLRDKGRPNHRIYYKKVAQAEKLGPYQVRFVFKPNADGNIDHEMPLIMGLMPVLPQHDWINRDFDKTGYRIPIGSGPYIISALNPGRSITYKRNPEYWGRNLAVERGLHNFDEIHIDYYRDDGIALEAFKAGQFDMRRENDATRWATAYDFPAAQDGRVQCESLPHQRTEPVSGFIFNTRRSLFRDDVLRKALEYTFDFTWINRTLFHNQFKRTESYFPNSELEAPLLPEGKELELLNRYRAQLPADIFTTPVRPPAMDDNEQGLRDGLLKASSLLRDAGYSLRNDVLYTPNTNVPVAFEILLNDPSEEKVALTWARALKRLGIVARIHAVDSAQYQARLAQFDYDVTSNKWFNSLSPGNEQMNYWGSAAANQPGSRNYAGIQNPIIDSLAASLPSSTTREELVSATHALDRLLMTGHYIIPFYYWGHDNIAYWTQHLHHPATTPLYGLVQESWWYE